MVGVGTKRAIPLVFRWSGGMGKGGGGRGGRGGGGDGGDGELVWKAVEMKGR